MSRRHDLRYDLEIGAQWNESASVLALYVFVFQPGRKFVRVALPDQRLVLMIAHQISACGGDV